MDGKEPQVAEPRGARQPRPWAGTYVGYMLAVAGLLWVFHDVDFRRLWEHMGGITWSWVAVAILFDVLSYFCQGIRWQLLLHPLGRVSSLRATQAVYAGLFTNEVLPLRFGEVVRAYLVSRWLSVDLLRIVPSLAVERLFDALWMGLAIGVTAIFVPLPRDLAEAADALGIIAVVATVIFATVVFRARPSLQQKPRGRIRNFLALMARELQTIGRSPQLYASLGISLLLLLFQALAFWLMMVAYGMKLSFWVGAVVFLIVHLGTALPNAPANIGVYQFFTVFGLALFGVEKTYATGFSVVVFVLLTVPLWVLGFLALSRSGKTLAEIRRHVGNASLSD